jgi:hypothetical protein
MSGISTGGACSRSTGWQEVHYLDHFYAVTNIVKQLAVCVNKDVRRHLLPAVTRKQRRLSSGPRAPGHLRPCIR